MKGIALFATYVAPCALAAQDCEMSLRAFAVRLLHNGRCLLGTHVRKNIRLSVLEDAKASSLRQGAAVASNTHAFTFVRNVRRLLIDNVLNRLSNTLAADVRRKAAKRLLFGDSRPFLALVGVTLASGSGILTKEDELEGVCWEIREAVSRMEWTFDDEEKELLDLHQSGEQLTLDKFELGPNIGRGCNAVVYSARLRYSEDRKPLNDSELEDFYPFAMKIMFNYYAESNAISILRAMYREGVPALWDDVSKDLLNCWQSDAAARRQQLPAHPNIVKMYCSFTDAMPCLPDSWSVYPNALPSRINPHGDGRNMSLFLVMKRYDSSLKEYLSKCNPSPQIASMLLAQLLEAVAHMNSHGIAHRDLKADNILLDLSEGDDVCPSLVLTDFGCCLADREYGLNMPYPTFEVDRGGNPALMAPEVACAKPGLFTHINYSKSDVWAVGSIAYQLFGMPNPFYEEESGSHLKTTSYKDEDLPPIPEQTPTVIAHLIRELLPRNPSQCMNLAHWKKIAGCRQVLFRYACILEDRQFKYTKVVCLPMHSLRIPQLFRKRLGAELAATICQLYLWAPSSWLRPEANRKSPSNAEILQWLLSLTTKILCESARWVRDDSPSDLASGSSTPSPTKRKQEESSPRRILPEYHLISSFLQRVNLAVVRDGLSWIENVW